MRKKQNSKHLKCWVLICALLFCLLGVVSMTEETECTVKGLINGQSYIILNRKTGNVLVSQVNSGYPVSTASRTAASSSEKFWKFTTFSSGCGLSLYSSTGGTVSNAYLGRSNAGAPVVFLNTQVELSIIRLTDLDEDNEGYYYISLMSSGVKYYLKNASGSTVSFVTTADAYCVWSIYPATRGVAKFQTQNGGPGFSTTGSNANFQTTFSSKGYSASYQVNATPTALATSLQGAGVFVYNGHGGAGYLKSVRENLSTGATVGYYATQEGVIGDDPDNYYMTQQGSNAFAKARCVLFLGCNTGKGEATSTNLVLAAFDKGAHFVLGTKRAVNVSETGPFMSSFLTAVSNDWTVGRAVYAAMNTAHFICDTDIKIVGDEVQFFS